MQFSVTARNARLDALETAIGTGALLELFTGAKPANCAAADSGTKVAAMTLPSDWLAAAVSGAKAKSGTWEDTSADAAGTVGHFRIKDSTGATCHIQGTVSITGAGGELQLDNNVLAAGQQVVISSFTITDGNA